MSVTAPRQRLRSQDRREQLLGAATELIIERGPAGLTMEGIAERAGVNKALPYRHFDNAQSVLVELLVRFNTLLGTRLLAALDAHPIRPDRLRTVVSTYLDVVSEHQAFLSVTYAPGSEATERAAREVGAQEFTADLVGRGFGVPRREAAVVGEMLQAILAGAARSLGARSASRKRIEALAFAACLAVIDVSAT